MWQIKILSKLELVNFCNLNVIAHSKDKKAKRTSITVGFIIGFVALMIMSYVGGLSYGFITLGAEEIVPAYIVLTNIYHLGNNPLIYFVTGWASCWGVILYRTFFQGIPDSLIEAAKIDGATELKVLWYVVLPMSKAIFGIQYFQGVLGSWGAYQTSMIYLTRSDMKPFWTFQYFLQRILQNNELIKQSFALIGQTTTDYPTTTLKYAMCVLSILPILVLFPYIQKYFSKGIAVGSVKG